MRQVPRELFAPGRTATSLSRTHEIPLLHGQSMLPAKVHGRILQALAIGPADVALEVGAGSGYLTACMGKLASQGAFPGDLPGRWRSRRAQTCFATAVNNVAVETADALQLDEQFAYDAIAVTGSLRRMTSASSAL